MAIEFKRENASGQEEADDRRRREAERTREEFGIATLTHDEELIDDATFSQMHDRLAMARSDADPDASPARASAEPGAPDEADELLLEEIATVLPTQSPTPGVSACPDAGPPQDIKAVAALERRLLAAKDRDEVAAIALGIARHYAVASALFVVNKGLVAGLRGSGGGLEDRIEGIMIPTEAECVLSEPLATGGLIRATPPLGSVDQRVLRALGRENVHHVAVLPIAIGDRVVNLLYVDSGEAPLAETALAALRVLCVGVGRVYQRLIMERKQAGAS